MAEMLICLGLIAALAAILIPSLGQFKPDRNKMMFKKAYLLTERIVYELVNDEDLYKSGTGVVGFDNVDEVTYNGVTFGGKDKFCRLFADNDRLRIRGIQDFAPPEPGRACRPVRLHGPPRSRHRPARKFPQPQLGPGERIPPAAHHPVDHPHAYPYTPEDNHSYQVP